MTALWDCFVKICCCIPQKQTRYCKLHKPSLFHMGAAATTGERQCSIVHRHSQPPCVLLYFCLCEDQFKLQEFSARKLWIAPSDGVLVSWGFRVKWSVRSTGISSNRTVVEEGAELLIYRSICVLTLTDGHVLWLVTKRVRHKLRQTKGGWAQPYR